MHPTITSSPGGRVLNRHMRYERLHIVGGNSPALRPISARTIAERQTAITRTAS